MITAELVNYIRGQIAQGQNLETIKTSLLSQKWSEADINEAFSQIGTSQVAQPPQDKTQTITSTTTDTKKEKISTKSLVVIILLIFLYPVGLICMYFLTKWKCWAKLLITLPMILIALILAFSILSVNPQEAIKKAEQLKAKCASLCTNNTNYETCYNQCLSNRKQIK